MACGGLLFTIDFIMALKMYVKLPFLYNSNYFSSMPVFSDKQFKTVALVFVAAVLVSTLISMCIYVMLYQLNFKMSRYFNFHFTHQIIT